MHRIADSVGDLSRIAAGIPFEIGFVLSHPGDDVARAAMRVTYRLALPVAPFDASQRTPEVDTKSTISPDLFAE